MGRAIGCRATSGSFAYHLGACILNHKVANVTTKGTLEIGTTRGHAAPELFMPSGSCLTTVDTQGPSIELDGLTVVSKKKKQCHLLSEPGMRQRLHLADLLDQ